MNHESNSWYQEPKIWIVFFQNMITLKGISIHDVCLSICLWKMKWWKNNIPIKIKNLLIFVFTEQYFSLNSKPGLSNFMQKRKNWWASSETCTGHKWMDGHERENRQTAKSLDNTSFYDGSINH